MAKDKFLAVAFTDLNGNNKYDGKDALIAGVVDANHDKTVSVGDTIVFGAYPHLDGTQAGTFTQTTAGVSGVGQTPDVLSVASGNHDLFWRHPPTGPESFSADGVEIVDQTEANPIDADQVRVFGVNGWPQADTFVNESALQPGDQGFLDIFIA